MNNDIHEGIDEELRREREAKRNAIEQLKIKRERYKRIVEGVSQTIEDLENDLKQI